MCSHAGGGGEGGEPSRMLFESVEVKNELQAQGESRLLPR